MKKILKIFFVPVLGLSLIVSACSVNVKNVKNVDDVSISENNNVGENLLYREYSIGQPYSKGEIKIDTSLIIQNITGAEKILVFFNDKPYTEVNISDSIFIKLDNAGYYAFYLEDINGEWYDISYAVSIYHSLDNPVLFLQESEKDEEK